MQGRGAVAADRVDRRPQDMLVVLQPPLPQIRDRNRFEGQDGGGAALELGVRLGGQPAAVRL